MIEVAHRWQLVLSEIGVDRVDITCEGYNEGYIILDRGLYRCFCRYDNGIFQLGDIGFILITDGAVRMLFNKYKSAMGWRVGEVFVLDMGFTFTLPDPATRDI